MFLRIFYGEQNPGNRFKSARNVLEVTHPTTLIQYLKGNINWVIKTAQMNII